MHAPQGPASGTSGDATTPAGGRRSPLSRLTLRRGSATDAEAPRRSPQSVPPEPAHDDHEDDVDWRSVGVFGAGLAIGALLGVGAALLMAPASGFETRMRLARGARRARGRAADRWDTIEDRVRAGARRSRRNLERKLTLARWRAQDAWERKRYGDVG
jgi:YtxH-like protein